MVEIVGQQSFPLGTEPKVNETGPIKKVERDSRDRILTTRSPVYKTPNDDQDTFGTVTGRSGYWVRPIGKFQELTEIRALEDINLVDLNRKPVIVVAGDSVFTPRHRLINPKAPKKSPRGRR